MNPTSLSPVSSSASESLSQFEPGHIAWLRDQNFQYSPGEPSDIEKQLLDLSYIPKLKAQLGFYQRKLLNPEFWQGTTPKIAEGLFNTWIKNVMDIFPEVWDNIVVIGDENNTLRQHIEASLRALLFYTSERDNLPASLPNVRQILACIFHDVGKPLSVAKSFQTEAGQKFVNDKIVDFAQIQEDIPGKKALRKEAKKQEHQATKSILLGLKNGGIEETLGYEFIDLTLGLSEILPNDEAVSGNPLSNYIQDDISLEESVRRIRSLCPANVPLDEFFSYLLRHTAADGVSYTEHAEQYSKDTHILENHPSKYPGMSVQYYYETLFKIKPSEMGPGLEGIHHIVSSEVMRKIHRLRETLGISEYSPAVLNLGLRVQGEIEGIMQASGK